MTNKRAKFETLNCFCLLLSVFLFFFVVVALTGERIFIKTDLLYRTGKLLSAGASVHLSAWIFLQVGAVKGLRTARDIRAERGPPSSGSTCHYHTILSNRETPL